MNLNYTAVLSVVVSPSLECSQTAGAIPKFAKIDLDLVRFNQLRYSVALCERSRTSSSLPPSCGILAALIEGPVVTALSQKQITELLVAWGNGDSSALEKLTPLVYHELHRLARRYMGRERPGHTLQTSALVNEAYIRLIDWKNVEWRSRAHFFAVSAQVMRRILVDFARSRGYAKRGGRAHQVSFEEAMIVSEQRGEDLVALDEALNALAQLDGRQSRVVELKFFGGLNLDEIAEVLEVSVGTVRRDWSLARAWLHRELSKADS
jgi:RNA polymerase sigma factor (TIGR02999 family)